ncbi:hypothetical protein WN51_02439 [Melipona quadrifasciata]|uniref:Uncharacterized protein n=1 Tax=Melipona quadrifasciata TaxID=166423 RepID=A0A0N0BE92_9HYME|nr:hypothetical protein WN51_02439 [Melipona quadrifasciata]
MSVRPRQENLYPVTHALCNPDFDIQSRGPPRSNTRGEISGARALVRIRFRGRVWIRTGTEKLR